MKIKSFNAESLNSTLKNQNPIAIGSKVKNEEARLIIDSGAGRKDQDETSLVTEEAAAYSNQTTNSSSGSKLVALDKIRKQFRSNVNTSNTNNNHPLQTEPLQKAWTDYIQLLKNAKNPAVPSFERSALRIKDANSFEVVSTNNLEQKFIERERNKLFSFLRQQLHNDLLQFNVIVEENSSEPAKHEASLTAREQFQKMSEQYPLLKELKDRLRLELDY